MSIFSPDTLFLSSERTFLRCPKLDDYTAWKSLYLRSLDFLKPYEPERPRDYVTNFSHFSSMVEIAETEIWQDKGYRFFIFDKETSELLGGIALSNLIRGSFQNAHCGYWIGEKFTRQGFMTEALSETVRFVFRHLKLHRVQASCLVKNERSIGLLEKLKFRNEGIAKGYLKIDGKWQDHIRFAMTFEDYLNNKEIFE